MASTNTGGSFESGRDVLVVRKTIRATAEFLFDAWTQPEQLKKWWGPANVTCVDAMVDLRIGGGFRLANKFPDGNVLWIAGEFEVIERPHKLVYSWRVEMPQPYASERVTVRFEPRGGATEVVVEHERIPNADMRKMHEAGWVGCLDGLAEYVGAL